MNTNEERKRTTRLTRAVFSVISALMLFSLLALFTFAADSTSPYDAQFGELYYENLSDAIEAANSSASGGTVTVLRDVNLSECLTISKDVTLTGKYTIYRADSYTAGLFTVDAGTTLTLDGGITIDGGNEWIFDEESYVYDMENVKVYDSSKTYVTAESGAPVATDSLIKVYGSVNVNEATIQNNYGSSALDAYSGGSITMNGGALAKHNYKNGYGAVVYSHIGSTVVLNDGVEMCENVTKGHATVIYLEGALTMNGDEVHHNYNIGNDGSFILMRYGADFTLNDGYIHDNYAFTDNFGAAIVMYYQEDSNGNGGASFEMNGGTVGPNYGNNYTTFYGTAWSNLLFYVNDGKIINVDGTSGCAGSYIYYGTDSYFGENAVIEGGTFDIRMCIINKAVVNADVRVIYYIARMFDGGGTINGDMIFDFAGVENKNAVFYNGTVNGDLVLNQTAFVSILDGVFNGDVIAPSGSKLTISDGIYNGELLIDDGATLSITGGKFKDDPSAYLPGYYETIYDEETGYYTVSKYYEASFGGVNYNSLEEAIAAANTAGGGTVTLLHDVDLDSSITLSSDILLEGAYSVVRSDSYTGNLFTVEAGATLTLDGGITIDGGNDWTLTDEFMADLNAGISIQRQYGYYVVPEEGAPIAKNYMINVLGAVIMNSATVCNNYADADTAAPFHLAAGATLTTNSGAILRDNCSPKSSALIKAEKTCTWIINDGSEFYGNYAGSNGGLSNMMGQVVMNGGDVHDNYLNYGAGTFIMLNGAGSSLTMNGGHVHDNYNIPNGTSTSGVIYVHADGIFTMNGGIIEGNHGINNSGIACARDTSKVYLNGGVLRHELSTNPDAISDSLLRGTIVIGEDMLIEGGRIRIRCSEITIDGTVNSDIVPYLASTTINGEGTVNGDVNIIDATAFVIEGGKWLGKMNVAETGGLSITGGSFRENPTDWTAEGYHPVYSNETELYTVILTPVASIGGTKYDTLAEAVAAAEDGDVINVIASHKLADSVTIDKAVTVDMKNQTITLSPAAAVAFVIEAEATFRGDGTVNTDNGNSKVFVIGSESTAGSLTIEDGSYIGESTVAAVENGSLNITGGDFAVNPDVAEGETADHSALLTVSESANTSVSITGGRFRSFNPESAGGGYLEDSHDAAEESGDYYNVLAHLFEHYVSDGNATCTADGTKTAKCKYCELTDTITEVGTKLQHVFLHYISDGNATCTEDGTRTAKCEGCDVTFTIPDTRSALGHSFTDYKSNGDATCKANGTRTAKCDHCDETRTIMEAGTKLPHTYEGLTCTACGNLRIWLIAVIIFCCVGLLMFLPLMII